MLNLLKLLILGLLIGFSMSVCFSSSNMKIIESLRERNINKSIQLSLGSLSSNIFILISLIVCISFLRNYPIKIFFIFVLVALLTNITRYLFSKSSLFYTDIEIKIQNGKFKTNPFIKSFIINIINPIVLNTWIIVCVILYFILYYNQIFSLIGFTTALICGNALWFIYIINKGKQSIFVITEYMCIAFNKIINYISILICIIIIIVTTLNII